jgi:hypothetical protein
VLGDGGARELLTPDPCGCCNLPTPCEHCIGCLPNAWDVLISGCTTCTAGVCWPDIGGGSFRLINQINLDGLYTIGALGGFPCSWGNLTPLVLPTSLTLHQFITNNTCSGSAQLVLFTNLVITLNARLPPTGAPPGIELDLWVRVVTPQNIVGPIFRGFLKTNPDKKCDTTGIVANTYKCGVFTAPPYHPIPISGYASTGSALLVPKGC